MKTPSQPCSCQTPQDTKPRGYHRHHCHLHHAPQRDQDSHAQKLKGRDMFFHQRQFPKIAFFWGSKSSPVFFFMLHVQHVSSIANLPSKGHQSWCEEDGSPFQKKTIAGLQKSEDGHGGTRISRGLKWRHPLLGWEQIIRISGRVFECYPAANSWTPSAALPCSGNTLWLVHFSHPATSTTTSKMCVEAHLKPREHRREQTCPVKCRVEIWKDHWQSLPFQPTSGWPLEKSLKWIGESNIDIGCCCNTCITYLYE